MWVRCDFCYRPRVVKEWKGIGRSKSVQEQSFRVKGLVKNGSADEGYSRSYKVKGGGKRGVEIRMESGKMELAEAKGSASGCFAWEGMGE